MLLTKQLLAFRPNKMDFIFATKTFLAGILALYIAFTLNLAYPIWAIGTVFVIANPYAGMVSSKSLFRLLGTLFGAIVSVIVTPFFINTPLLFTLFLAIWVGGCLYLSLLDRTPRSYIFMLAGYTTVIICYNVIYDIDKYNIFDMAVGRFLEISLGVVCSAVVTTTIFPLHIGPAVKARVSKTFKDTHDVFDKILLEKQPKQDYSIILGSLARDISDIHIMAIHLSYEKSTLQGMTKPLQEMLNQMAMLVSNLVAISECVKQLDLIDSSYRKELANIHKNILVFLNEVEILKDDQLNQLPVYFDQYFERLLQDVNPEQKILLLSLKMDIRHFTHNICAIKLIWRYIQQGNSKLPESISNISNHYPRLHRDHGVAVRGGISAGLVVLIATGFWILSGWQAGFMMAEMAAISACILTSMDNPVPALKMFIRASVYAGIAVFIYAFGIFPHVTSFWQLALVLAPFIIFCLTLFSHPPLIGIGLPLLMGTIMGLNLQNRYNLDQVFFFDGSIGTIIGPIISVVIIHLVRAMSPEITVKRILSLHYKAIRQSLYLPYGVEFRAHLCNMLDRIGVLNTKVVQSEYLKQQINLALIESSAVIDLIRIQELSKKMSSDADLVKTIIDLQQNLDKLFKQKELGNRFDLLQENVLNAIAVLRKNINYIENPEVEDRVMISLDNIQSSLCHVPLVKSRVEKVGA